MFMKNFLPAIFGFVFLFILMTIYEQNAFSSEFKSVWMKNLPYESWMNATMLGVKVGYMHTRVDRDKHNGQDVLRVNSVIFNEIKRFGMSIKLNKTKLFYIGDDLTPMYFISKSDETGQEKVVEGTVQNGTVKMKTTLEGKTTEKVQKLPPDTIFAEAIEEITIRKGLNVGNKFNVKAFSIDLYDIVDISVNVLKKEKITYKGQIKDTFIVDYTMDIMGGITSREWMTADGEIYKMETLSLGMSFDKVDMVEALGEAGQLDLILQTKIELQGERPKPNIEHFKVKVSIPEGNILKTFANNNRQKVTSGKDTGEGIVDVTIHDINENNATRRPITSKEFTKYLSPSIYVQSDDPDIIAKAQEIAGSEENSWKSSIKICEWVNQNMKDKNYRVGFGTAKQTLKDLSGDCSEHTVLFIGLARALGIPSRICTGIVYHKDAFYYHFWPEVYIGRWISMDPTLGQIQADASHIQLSSTQIETESNIELGEGVVRTLNKLSIERIE
jgi:hypothetical protein